MSKLSNKYDLHFIECQTATNLIRESALGQAERDAYQRFTQSIYKDMRSNNIKTILNNERTILLNELNGLDTSDKYKPVHDSLLAGIDRMDKSISCLSTIASYRKFEAHVLKSSDSNMDKRGLPTDQFTEKVPGQIASLQNHTKVEKAPHIQEFLFARIEALKYAKNLYEAVMKKHMIKFCREHEDHVHAKRFMAIKANKKLVDIIKNNVQVTSQKKTLER